MSTQPPVSDQEMPLLRTKLYIPAPRPQLVPRPRLIERLNAGLGHKLTLVSAPAGFGKTTLISEWMAGCGRLEPKVRGAWLSLDEGDNDLTGFLTYLVAALQTVEANIGKGVLSALGSPQSPPVEALLTSLINEIAALPDRIVLVLGDYHLIDVASPASAPIHDALIFLLRRLAPPPLGGIHLVLVTREDPPLSLARLRARGQLSELRASDLRFTPAEAAEFLNQVMGLDLSAQDIATLETRTEGWVAGLQLAAISMQGRKDTTGFIQSFTGSHHFVLDYLLEEVLEQQPVSVQAFLLQTAVLDRLTGPLCDALTGQDDGRMTLEMLQHANLFVVPLDDERRWYRYHHLFAELLRECLRQTQPEQVSTLHTRASEWCEQNGLIDQTIRHALCANDYEQTAHLIKEHGFERIYLSQTITVHRWLEALPRDFIRSRPILGIIHAWALMLGPAPYSKELIEQRLQQVEEAMVCQSRQLEHSQEREPYDYKWINGHIDTIRASKARIFDDNHQTTVDLLDKALSLLPDQDFRLRGIIHNNLGLAYLALNSVTEAEAAFTQARDLGQSCGSHYTILFAASCLADIALRRGQLQAAMQVCQGVLPSLNGHHSFSEGVLPIHGAVYILLGYILLEQNNLADADCSLTRGIELIQLCGEMEILLRGSAYLARLKQAQGDPDSALKLLEGARRVWPDADAYVDALIANVWLKQGDGATQHFQPALRWAQCRCNALEETGEIPAAIPRGERIFATLMTVSKVLIAYRQVEKTVDLFPVHRFLEQQIHFAELRGWRERVIELSILEALAWQAEHADVKALSSIRRAVELAEPEGYIRVFLNEGPPMARLLYEAVTRDVAGHGPVAQYARRLLSAFPVAEPEQAAPSDTQAAHSELVEPLSERELEVLELFAEGLTNQEIASQLFLALNTVKAHSRNIYGKLGVHSRTQAVARARALGVLSPI